MGRIIAEVIIARMFPFQGSILVRECFLSPGKAWKRALATVNTEFTEIF
jgi:hypothetical protein